MKTLERVRAWLTVGGVSHIVAHTNNGWSATLCDSLWSYSPDKKPPVTKRVCRRCRRAYQHSTPTPTQPERTEE